MRTHYQNQTGFRGVQPRRNSRGEIISYRAYIYDGYEKIQLGTYDTPEKASAAHEEARAKRDRGELFF